MCERHGPGPRSLVLLPRGSPDRRWCVCPATKSLADAVPDCVRGPVSWSGASTFSEQSPPARTLPVRAPTVVRNVTVAPASPGSVHLAWLAPEDDGGLPVIGHLVSRGTTSHVDAHDMVGRVPCVGPVWRGGHAGIPGMLAHSPTSHPPTHLLTHPRGVCGGVQIVVGPASFVTIGSLRPGASYQFKVSGCSTGARSDATDTHVTHTPVACVLWPVHTTAVACERRFWR